MSKEVVEALVADFVLERAALFEKLRLAEDSAVFWKVRALEAEAKLHAAALVGK